MANYGNTRVGGRSIFGNRKVRKNAGVKRGPRKARVLGPTNVIVVRNGGVANVVAARGPKKTRGRTYGPMFVGPLRPQNTRRSRKTRSNKGVARTMGLRRLFG
jgi:hypothetical protein